MVSLHGSISQGAHPSKADRRQATAAVRAHDRGTLADRLIWIKAKADQGS